MEYEFVHNKDKNQFELHLNNGLKAFVSYEKNNNHLDLVYSEVPEEFRGKGIGKILVEKTFEAIEKGGYTAKAHCSYVKSIAINSDYWSNIINF